MIYTCATYKDINPNNTIYIDLNNGYTFTVSRDEKQLVTYPTFNQAIKYVRRYLKSNGKKLERI